MPKKNYIRITERNFKIRKHEHMAAVRKGEINKSAIAKHLREECDLDMKWEEGKIIANESTREKNIYMNPYLFTRKP